jgi:hypothetical protein
MALRLRRIAPEATCFALVAGAYLAHFALTGYDRFYWDAAHYWELGRLYGKDGGFSLFSFDDPIRGYSVGLLYYVVQQAGAALHAGDVTIIRLTGALLAATIGVVVAPRLARHLFSAAAVTWPRVLVLNALVFLFWRDHFQFPLSDFPALLAACLGVLGLLRGGRLGYLGAGLALGLAANLRPSYVLAAVGAVVVVAVLPRRPWRWLERGTAVALVLAGGFIASSPQMAINHHHRGSWSPGVPEANDVGLKVLQFGVFAQKHETYVGPRDRYPIDSVLYFDPLARHLLPRIESYDDYVRIVLTKPHTMAGSYGLHTFNGLDVRYPTPYIRDLSDRPLFLPLLQFTLVFVALARLALPDGRRQLGAISWTGIALLVLPILVTIPTAVEPRYFLSAHLLVFMLVCFGPETRAMLLRGSTLRRVGLAACYVEFMAVCLVLSEATQAQIQHPLTAADPGATASSPSFEDLERTCACDDDEALAVE